MIRAIFGFSVVAASATSIWAQSTDTQIKSADPVTQTVTQLSGDTRKLAPTSTPSVSQPAIINVLTVIGNNTLGLPCLNCLLGFLVPTLGLPLPLSQALPGNTYQIDSYIIDNTYDGPCTFTFAVLDSNNNALVSKKQTLTEKAQTQVLLSTPVTIPTSAGIGLGSVSTTAVCGSSQTQSKSPVYIACVTNPPFCVE